MQLKLEHLREEILSRYNNGETATSIANSLGEYLQAVTNVIKKYTGKTKLIPDQGNVRYFSKIDTHTKAYLLGFIAADGCIQRVGNSVGLTVTIHIKDRVVLDTLKSEIGNAHSLQLV
ncbi:MAG TPA: hypothetical protein VFM18_22540, partial [Methanosarcina sp.]|nr:hypothetical protein [Methanosarcina sp.]